MAKKLVFDKLLFTTIIVLVALGLVMVYSASLALDRDAGGAPGAGVNRFFLKQAIWAALGLVAMWAAMHVDHRLLRRPPVAWGLLGGTLALLVLVLFGPALNETHRWLFVAGLSVQPSEIAKLTLVGFIAYQLDRKAGRVNEKTVLLPCFLAVSLVCGLVLLQPDYGTAVLLAVGAVTLLFLGGLAARWVVGAALLASPLVAWLALAAPYRRERLLSFLHPDRDPLGAGFQAMQSLIAVGSGGILGLGPGQSVQKLYFLPYPHSDFIYSIVAEELGLVGALALVALFGLLLWRGLRAGFRAPDSLGRHLAWGITVFLVLQALLNVSVALALLPTKGISLPFISYGGSGLLMALTGCGVLLNVSQHG